MNVLLFGITKEIVGERKLSIDVSQLTDVSSLLSFLEKEYASFGDLKSVAVAVNEEYVAHNYILKPTDEVAIIPPVSGG